MKDKGQVYLVHGEHGGYSDHRSWTVAAFTDEDRANLLAEICRHKVRVAYAAYREEWDRAREMAAAAGPNDPVVEWPEREDFAFPEDPEVYVDVNTSYSVEAVVLDPEVPNV